MIWQTDDGNTWKIHLTKKINLMPSKDSNEKCLMHSKSNNTEIIISNESNEITEDTFWSLLLGYQIGLEESMRTGDFVFYSI